MGWEFIILVLGISMKEVEQGSNQIEFEDQNYILKAWKDLKDSIFNVLFVMLDKDDDEEEEETMYGIAFQSGFDYLQMLAFPFDASIIAVWNGGDTLEKVFQIFSRFNISTYLPGVSFDTFLILLYALILLIILVLLDIIYVSYSFSKKKFRFTWPLVILAQLVPLFVTILFLPITETLLSVVRCKTDEVLGYQVMISFPDIVCWKGWHLFHAAVTLLFSSLFVFISSVVALALFEPRMATNKLTARQNSTGQIVFIMNKIICQLIFSFNPFQQKWVYSVMLFCLSGWLYWTYNMNDPFYNKKASKFFRIVSSYYFWTNFMLMVSQLLSPLGFNGGLVIWISGLPFIGAIITFEHKSNIDQLFSSNLKFKSGRELESHLVYVLQLVQNQDEDKNTYMLMTGYIEKHKEICVEDDCPFKSKKKRHRLISEKEDLTEKLLKQLERMYKLGIKKYPTCTRLRLSFAFFQLERLKNKNKAYEELTYAQKTDPTFEEEFIIYRFKKIIRENLENAGEDNTTDLIELIRFDNHISLCEEAMLQVARLHKEFWTQLKEETPELKKLNTLGSRITKTVNTVRENYAEISKINSSVPEVLHCYAVYLILVANEVAEGKKLFEIAHKVYSEKINMSSKNKAPAEEGFLNESQLEDSEHAILMVSAKKGSVGKILNTNLLFTELSGYYRKEIIERNIEKIMPEIFCTNEAHGEKMEEWVGRKDASAYEENCTDSQYIGELKMGYIRQKLGYVVMVEYRVLYSHLDERFIVTFKTLSNEQNYCHLILDQNGIIKDCSYMANLLLGLDRGQLEEKQIDVEEWLGMRKLDKLAEEHGNQPFQYEISCREEKMMCRVQLKSVYLKMSPDYPEEDASEMDHLVGELENRCIGYYLSVFSPSMSQKQINLAKERRQSGASLLSLDYHEVRQSKVNIESESIEDMSEDEMAIPYLYDDPNVMDILISNLAEQKTTMEKQELFKLTTKIKTMRLLRNEIKMVYDQSNNVDFDRGDSEFNDEDDYEQIKLNDESYHEKIRSAINTKLNHIQVAHLRLFALLFVLGLVGCTVAQMIISPKAMNQNYMQVKDLYQKAKEGNFLNQAIVASLDPQSDSTLLIQKLAGHEISLNSSRPVVLSVGEGMTIEKNLTDAFLLFYSRLQEYFETGRKQDLTNLYENYLGVMEEAIQEIVHSYEPYSIIVVLLGIASFIVSGAFLLVWIFIRLSIDKKKIGILLWFLDIPISYVSYLGDHCDSYLKNFISIKEVMNKGLSTDENYLYFQEYPDKEVGKDNEVEEQQKVRKILIMKQRKQTLLSRIDLSYLKMIWVLVFGTMYSILCVAQIETLNQRYDFLEQQWIYSSRSVLWADSIPLTTYLMEAGYNTLGGRDIAQYQHEAKSKFSNSLRDNDGLLKFSESILGLQNDQSYGEFSQIFIKVYFTDLCVLVGGTQPERCGLLAESSMKGGYRIFQSFLSLYQNFQKEELRETNQKYGSNALLLMLSSWEESLGSMVGSAVNICSIIFYVFIFMGVLGFLICWLLYLGKVNREINEAIRMLNMIPFRLLSNARKETREFIVWIIREANIKKHHLH